MGSTDCTMGLKSFTNAAAVGLNSVGNGRIGAASSGSEEPLNVNRLKQIDKMRSDDGEVCNLIPLSAPYESTANGTLRHSLHDMNDNTRFCLSEEMGVEDTRNLPSRCTEPFEGKTAEESSSEQEEADEEVSNVFRHVQIPPTHSWTPNKSQVLCYLNSASTLLFKKTGTELQVTDSAGFPLFDIWVKMDCFRQTLVLESYGRIVLLLTDNTNLFGFSTRKSEPPTITIYDWNHEIFGYFVPGDPFIIENAKKMTIAKLINLEMAEGRTSSLWQCVLEGSGEEIASLEDCKTLRYSGNVGFQVRLLTLAAAVRIATMRRTQPRARCCCISRIFSCCSCGSR
ncbi:hypothetical protein QR680_001408 [Steinernema hermaphroditum]|uniref:Uncharacterized protein n=1 Tax=Steinernema hermaphroditum TaxID=289476 RepID=A0AA39H0Z8_9BILA|nr:hypothetical protein QR680_001408 [Steinernema hermaphroditum]